MGRSLHNKIHLGRRNPLLNMGRIKMAGCILAVASVVSALFVSHVFK